MTHPALDTSRLAVVYLRQSTEVQAQQDQRALADVAASHGFPQHQILVVDDDLGLSGRTIE